MQTFASSVDFLAFNVSLTSQCYNSCTGLKRLNDFCSGDPCNLVDNANVCHCEYDGAKMTGLVIGLLVATTALILLTCCCIRRSNEAKQDNRENSPLLTTSNRSEVAMRSTRGHTVADTNTTVSANTNNNTTNSAASPVGAVDGMLFVIPTGGLTREQQARLHASQQQNQSQRVQTAPAPQPPRPYQQHRGSAGSAASYTYTIAGANGVPQQRTIPASALPQAVPAAVVNSHAVRGSVHAAIPLATAAGVGSPVSSAADPSFILRQEGGIDNRYVPPSTESSAAQLEENQNPS